MKKKILIILLMFVVLIGLSGCTFKKSSNNNSKTKKTVKTEKVEKKNNKNKETKKKEKKNVTLNKDIVIGHYELIEMTDGKITYDKEDLEDLKATGYVVTIEFEKEKGFLKLGEESSEFKYDEKYLYFDDDKIQYEYSDNVLTLKQNEETLKFEKIK